MSSDLHEAASIQDRDPVGDLIVDPEVVRDDDEGVALLALEPDEGFQYLALHHHVQCRRRLVGEDDLRIDMGGQADHDALPHAPESWCG